MDTYVHVLVSACLFSYIHALSAHQRTCTIQNLYRKDLKGSRTKTSDDKNQISNLHGHLIKQQKEQCNRQLTLIGTLAGVLNLWSEPPNSSDKENRTPPEYLCQPTPVILVSDHDHHLKLFGKSVEFSSDREKGHR